MHFNLPLTKYGFQFTPVKAMNFGLHVEVIISLSKLRQSVIDWLIYLCDVDHFQFTFQFAHHVSDVCSIYPSDLGVILCRYAKMSFNLPITLQSDFQFTVRMSV